MRKLLLTTLVALSSSLGLMAANWVGPQTGDFPDVTTVYAHVTVNGNEPSQDLTVAAFIGDSCRAMCDEPAYLASTETSGSSYWLLKVAGGDDDVDKTITFRAEYNGVEYVFNNTATFSIGGGYDYPFDLNIITTDYITGISLPTSFTLDIEDEANKTVDLQSNLTFTITTPGSVAGETVAFADMESYPVLNWNSASTGTVTVSDEGVATAVNSSSTSGVEVTVCFDSDADINASTTIYVEPLAEEVVGMKIETPIEVAKGETFVLTDYISFQYLTGHDEQGNEQTTWRKYSDLDADEQENVDLIVDFFTPDQSDYTTYISYDEDTYTVGGVASTGYQGLDVLVQSKVYCPDYYAEGTILVTPIAYQVTGVSLPETIQVPINETVNLLDSITFTVIIDAQGTTADKKAADFYVDESRISWEYDEDYTSLEGNVLTGIKRTTADGVSLKLTYDNDVNAFTDEAIVLVTPIIVSLESITIQQEGADANEIYLTRESGATFKVTLNPANATFDPDKFEVEVYSGDQDCPDSWNTLVFDAADDTGLNWSVEAFALGNYYLAFYYDGEEIETETVTAHVGSTYNFSEGWNWVSNYDMPMQGEVLEVSSINDAMGGIIYDLRSQTQVTYNDANYGFIGDLTEMPSAAYKMKSTKDTTLVVYDGSYNVWNENSQNLYTPWTWVYYPYQYTRTLGTYDLQFTDDSGYTGTPFDDLTLTDGDKIISQNDGFVEYSNGVWLPDATFAFRQGQMYLFYLQAQQTDGINWPAEANCKQTSISQSLSAPARNVAWSYDAAAWADNMALVGTIEGADNANLSVGAFVNGECRGESQTVDVDGKLYYFVTVHGKAGETVTFQAFDGEQYQPLDAQVTFQGQCGSIAAPVTLGTIAGTNGINSLATEITDAAAIYDINGRRVTSTTAHGIYVVRKGNGAEKVVK